MGLSEEPTWRICILTTIPYTIKKNTSSQEPELNPLPSSPHFKRYYSPLAPLV
jgi:hypothetical protein